MRIGFDIQTLQTPEKDRGIGRATRQQLWGMIKNAPEHTFFLFGNRQYPEADLTFLATSHNWVVRYFDLSESTQELENQLYPQLDVIYHTSPLMPDIQLGEAHPDIVSAALLHDVIPLVYPAHYLDQWPGNIQQDYHDRLKKLHDFDLVFTNSHCTARDYQRLTAAPESQKIVVNPFGASPKPSLAKVEVKQALGIDQPYIFSLLGGDWRKNPEVLIAAYCQLPAQTQTRFDLVIGGRYDPAQIQDLTKTTQKHNIAGKLHFPGQVDDDVLSTLYQSASLFVFPSRYEGFGLPVLEAISLGTPALVANTSSLREILPLPEYQFDPENDQQLSQKILSMLSSPENLDEAAVRQRSAIADLSWEDNFARLKKVLSDAVNQRRPEKVLQKNKQKLYVLSPWPPARSGIADYALALARQLQQHFEVVLVHEAGADLDKEISKTFSLLPHDRFSPEKEAILLYHMGNHVLHQWLYELLLQYPGTTILHDYSIRGFIEWTTQHIGRQAAYEDEMKHIREAKSAYQDDAWNERILTASDQVIVHNLWSYRRLAAKRINPRVYWAGFGVNAPRETTQSTKQAIREKLDLPETALIVGSFGHIVESKRLDVALQAFGRFRKRHPEALYVIAGEVRDQRVNQVIRTEALQESVRLTGYVDEQLYHQYLEACDVCINLRYPSMGETSAALMDMMEHQLPVIVSAEGPLGELPDAVCWKVPVNDHEQNIIVDYLEAIAANPALREQWQSNQRDFLSEYHWSKIGWQYRHLLGAKTS